MPTSVRALVQPPDVTAPMRPGALSTNEKQSRSEVLANSREIDSGDVDASGLASSPASSAMHTPTAQAWLELGSHTSVVEFGSHAAPKARMWMGVDVTETCTPRASPPGCATKHAS